MPPDAEAESIYPASAENVTAIPTAENAGEESTIEDLIDFSEDKQMKKTPRRVSRMEIRIDHEVHNDLLVYLARRPGKAETKSSVVESALRAYLHPKEPYPAIFRALNRIENTQATTSSRVNMLGHVVLHFLRYWFVLWPDMSEEHNSQRKARSSEMMTKYLQSLRRRLDRKDLWDILDRSQIDDIIEDLRTSIGDLLTEDVEEAIDGQ